jgi:hypothetical protein
MTLRSDAWIDPAQGSHTSPQKLESFAQRLAEVIIQGELSVGDWDSKKGSTINVTFLVFAT